MGLFTNLFSKIIRVETSLTVQPETEIFRPPEKATQSLGYVAWSTKHRDEEADGPTVSKDLRLEESFLETLAYGEFYRLVLKLDDTYALEVAGGNNSMQGFAVSATKHDRSSFSWEWFVPQSDTSATKLQEGGTLSMRIEDNNITWIRFETDISLRIMLPDGLNHGHKVAVHNPDFRLTVKAGSEFVCPIEVDGFLKVKS